MMQPMANGLSEKHLKDNLRKFLRRNPEVSAKYNMSDEDILQQLFERASKLNSTELGQV
jgi:hypothetical protein